MSVEVSVPSEYQGSAVAGLSQRTLHARYTPARARYAPATRRIRSCATPAARPRRPRRPPACRAHDANPRVPITSIDCRHPMACKMHMHTGTDAASRSWTARVPVLRHPRRASRFHRFHTSAGSSSSCDSCLAHPILCLPLAPAPRARPAGKGLVNSTSPSMRRCRCRTTNMFVGYWLLNLPGEGTCGRASCCCSCCYSYVCVCYSYRSGHYHRQ